MKEKEPPKLVFRFLAWFCPPVLYEGIEGDLLESYQTDVGNLGKSRANIQLIFNVLKFFRPGIILRNRFRIELMNTAMVGNYFKVAARSMAKRKLYSFINAFGLSIAIAFCTLIYLFIQDERSFDQFHKNKAKICLMYGVNYTGNVERKNDEPLFQKTYHMQMGLAAAMKADLAQVEFATHFCKTQKTLSYKESIFKEDITYVDADFFKMFSFTLVNGNRAKLFEKDDEIVVTMDAAKKYFGRVDVLNELLMVEAKSYTVTGVIENPPANSSVQFSVLLPIQSWKTYNDSRFTTWFYQSYPTFVQLHEHADETALRAGIQKIKEKHMGVALRDMQASSNVPDNLPFYDINYVKLTDVHMQKELNFNRASDPQYAFILSGIAILILAIACINYILLSLTTSIKRRTEVGVRKAIGALRRQLIYQFSMESVILSVLSSVLGAGLVWLFLPAFNRFTGKAIEWQNVNLIPVLMIILGCSIMIGLLAGAYPSLHLSGFKPMQVLRGPAVRLSANFSKPLLVVQLVLSSFLIICSVIMYRQMEFVTTKDLGYNQYQLLVIPTQAKRNENHDFIERFRQRCSSNPDVVAIAAADYDFGGTNFFRVGYDAEDKRSMEVYVLSVDPYFLETIQIEVIKGRNFTVADGMDTVHSIIVNEAFVHNARMDNPIGCYVPGLSSRIIGVVKDFHFASLEREIDPMFLAIENEGLNNMLVRISGNNIGKTVSQLRRVFNEVASDKPFEYSFVDERVAQQYASYNRWTNAMGLSTLFAILISCLGLFGLSGINAVNRTKEIGIRKVMGAKLSNIFILLNKQYVFYAFIAFTLAIPLSWYAMNQWLESFKFAIGMGWEIFAFSILAGLAIALLTVSYHAIKAALINPADTLKHE